MRTFKIAAGAERNAEDGYIAVIEPPYQEKMFISPFAPETVVKFYRLGNGVTEPARKDLISFRVCDLAEKLARLAELEDIEKNGPNGGL